MQFPKHLLLFLACASGIVTAHAQQAVLVPYRAGNAWGFSDTLGKIVIKPAYDSVEFYWPDQKHLKVFNKLKTALLSLQGKQLTPFADFVIPHGSNHYGFVQNKKHGLSDKSGAIVLPADYDAIYHTALYTLYENEQNKVIAERAGKFYLVDLQTQASKEISNPKDHESLLSGDLRLAPFPENSKAVAVANPLYSSPVERRDIPIMDSLRRHHGYDSVTKQRDGVYISHKAGKKGVVMLNTHYKPIPPKYDSIELSRNIPVTGRWMFMLFRVTRNGKWFYVGENGVEYFRSEK